MVKLTSEPTREAQRSAVLPASSRRRPVQNHLTVSELIMRAFVTIFAASTLFGLVAAVVLAVTVPSWYRGLSPRHQAIWCHRVEALCDLQKTRPENDVLEVDNSRVDGDAALALLNESSSENDVLEGAASDSPDIDSTPAESLSVKGSNGVNQAQQQPTSLPEPTQSPLPTATPAPTIIAHNAVAALELSRFDWERQDWNNCGPTTVTIGLTFFGYSRDQYSAARFLKPSIEDKNVTPAELTEFVNSEAEGVSAKALWRVGGTPELLKALVDDGFPVIVERGIDVADSGWLGHYSLVVGYDDPAKQYTLLDSFFGVEADGGRAIISQEVINSGWKHFNNVFVVIYNPAREAQLQALLGNYADMTGAALNALEKAKADAAHDPDDKWAWFNMGSSLTMLGRYDEAVLAFDRARTLALPFRMLWYQFGPYEAYYHVGRYDDVLALALANERQTQFVEETYYYRGLAYAAQGDVEAAIRQFDRALAFNRNFEQATEVKQALLEGRYSPPV